MTATAGLSANVRYILGEEKPVRVTVTAEGGVDITSATATFEVYDSSGAQTLAPSAMTGDGSVTRRFTYTLTTGPGRTLPATGYYTGVVRVTYGAIIQAWRVNVHVTPRNRA